MWILWVSQHQGDSISPEDECHSPFNPLWGWPDYFHAPRFWKNRLKFEIGWDSINIWCFNNPVISSIFGDSFCQLRRWRINWWLPGAAKHFFKERKTGYVNCFGMVNIGTPKWSLFFDPNNLNYLSGNMRIVCSVILPVVSQVPTFANISIPTLVLLLHIAKHH